MTRLAALWPISCPGFGFTVAVGVVRRGGSQVGGPRDGTRQRRRAFRLVHQSLSRIQSGGFVLLAFLLAGMLAASANFLPCAQVSMMELTFRPTTHPLAYAHGRRLSQSGSVDSQVAKASNFARLPAGLVTNRWHLVHPEGGLSGPSSRPLERCEPATEESFALILAIARQARNAVLRHANRRANRRLTGHFPGKLSRCSASGRRL